MKQTAENRHICTCGRAPKRAGQRNCRLCHAIANRVYRARLKDRIAALEAAALHNLSQKQLGEKNGQETKARD